MKDKQAVLRRVDFLHVEPQLPAVVPLEDVSLEADVFVCALGFEERCPAISARIALQSQSFALGLTAIYSSNREDNEHNENTLLSNIGKFCARSETLAADQPDLLSHELNEQLNGLTPRSGRLQVIFDISTASGNLILSVLNALIKHSKSRPLDLTIAYSEPEEYLPTSAQYANDSESLVLTACRPGDESSVHEYGVAEVETNELYPGKSNENREEFILAVPAYRTERLSRCLQRLTDQPLADPDNFIFWILGSPPDPRRSFRLEMQRKVITSLLGEMSGHEQGVGVKAEALDDANSVEASTLHYQQILQIVIEKVDAQAGKNISVVHMGSKMQAVGMALALAVRSEVTVCHARPDRYNASLYSSGIGPAWGVRFEDLGEIVDSLGRIGTLELQAKIDR